MAHESNRLHDLFQQYLDNRINPEEYSEFWNLLQSESKKNFLSGELQSLWESSAGKRPVIPEEEWKEKMQRLIAKMEAPEVEPVPFRKTPAWKIYRWRVAAAAIILLVAGSLYFNNKHRSSKRSIQVLSVRKKDIPPGGNKAVLTLSNGATVILDSAANGTVATQGNVRVVKLSNGQIVYNAVNVPSSEVVYNTLSVPLGGQYQLVLPDGSRVWLDAASTIRFPTAFRGRDREVEITGEAYFEVAENVNMPFKVVVNRMEVEVLGTHFNVNAYDNEPEVKVTLVEGAVKVVQPTTHISQLLQPGEQARVDKEGRIELIKDIDVNEVVAWKNNLFWFDDNDIQTVMRQLSRWYNVDVVINGNIPQRFTGSIPRNVNVSKVFEVLQETGSIHFKIADKKIIVSP